MNARPPFGKRMAERGSARPAYRPAGCCTAIVPALRFTPRTSVRIDVPDASKDTSSNCIANYDENVVFVICCTAMDGDYAPSPQGREIRGGAPGSGSLGQGRFEESVVAIGAEESFPSRRSAPPIDVNGHRRVLM